MKGKILNVFKYLLFLAAGVFLFWYLYRDLEMDSLVAYLKDIKYEWILIAMLAGILSHISRAMRWQMLVNTLGYKPRFSNSFFSVMIAYLANLALPRLGEVTRPTIIKKYENIPYTTSFGTIVLERIIDFIILFILTGIALISEYSTLRTFLQENPDVYDKFIIIFKILCIAGVAGVSGLALFYFVIRKRIREFAFYKKFKEITLSFWEGVKTIRNLKNKVVFIFHSAFIWAMYFFSLYFCFLAFGFTENLGIMAALITFVIGSYGMVAPVQGGIGAWHFMVIATLLIYNVQFDDAKLFALVSHGVSTVVVLIGGAVSLILLPVFNRKKP